MTSAARRLAFAFVPFSLIVFDSQIPKAQLPVHFKNRSMLRTDSQKACWQFPDLGLTEQQTKSLESLQHDYTPEAMPLQRELLPLRFELRHLIRDPDIPSKVLLDRQKKISELQMKLGSLSFSYQMKVRSVFTREQLGRFPEDCLPGVEAGYEVFMSISRRPYGPRR